ncbi:MAG: IS1595 family transposase [Armatimonadetes bacterium]|nr:IS1595 family transposase [Armatimonadota bacterium]
MKPRYTLRDFQTAFPTEDACLEWLVEFLYPQGIPCPNCEKVTKHHKLKNRKAYSCDVCGHQAHPTAGTIYHKSSTPLSSWFYAIYLMSATRTGVPAKQLERELGVTYKTAWRMFKQIRSMLAEDVEPLSGTVEVDETYYGGKQRGRGTGRGTLGKTIVAGAVERDGDIVAEVVPNVKAKTLIPFVTENVERGSTVYTDEHGSYRTLPNHGYRHSDIPHDLDIFVLGDLHTNTIEGFWGNFKTGTRGAYKHIKPCYLQMYVNEYSFRYNRRRSNVHMFHHFMAQTRQLDWWVPYSARQ